MDLEQAPPSPAAPDVSFPIAYQVLFGIPNPDLQGRGAFVAVAGGDAFRFSGRKRGFFSRTAMEIEFSGDDIRNVAIAGRAVQFSTSRGRAGSAHQPFVFFCRDAATARAVADLLPKTVDGDFVENTNFQEKLHRISGDPFPMVSVTNLIIAINAVVFLAMAGFLGAGWVDVTDLTPYIRYGANNAAATTDGEWWRLLTSMFMHFGVLHLVLNMWALFLCGRLVERLQGRVLYGTTYLASGIGGGLLSLIWHGDKLWSAGASGAIFGVYGALLGYMVKEKHALPRAVFRPLMKSTLIFAGYNLFYGMVHPHIDNAAHLGGLATGIVLGWLTAMPLDQTVRASLGAGKLRLAVIASALIVGIGVAAAPRFDYSVREELAWDETIKGLADTEHTLVTRQNAALVQWDKSADNGQAIARLIDDDLVPFYRKFGRELAALQLSTGRRTAERRKVLARFVELRLESYGHLRRGVIENSRSEIALFGKLETQAAAAVQSLRNQR